MKVTLFMAMSVNGIIADEKGSEEFLSDTNWMVFSKLATAYGCFIVGRKTYEAVSSWSKYTFADVHARLKIIVSSNPAPIEGYHVASSPEEALRIAIFEGFDNAVLAGGSVLNTSFLERNLVDEIILNVEPALARGLPVVQNIHLKRLAFREAKPLSGGIVQLHYAVLKD